VRPRIAPAWLVLLLAAAVLLTLYAIVPRGDMRERIEAVGPPSDLSIAWLEAWLRVRPGDEALLSSLGGQYVALGRLDDALHIAEKMAAEHSDRMQADAARLRLAVAQQRTFALSGDDPRRAAAVAALREQVAAALSRAWSTHDLEWLAQLASGAEAPGLAARFYARLAVQDAARAGHWYQEAARYALQAGDYRGAANAWFAWEAAAPTVAEQRRAFISGIRALQSGNLAADALAAAQRQPAAVIDDAEVLTALLQLARAAQRPDLADRYAKALARHVGIRGVSFERPARASGAIHAMTGEVDGVKAAQADQVPSRETWAYMDGPYVAPHNGVAFRRAQHVSLLRVAAVASVSSVTQQAAAPAMASSSAAGSDPAELLYQSFVEASDLASAQKVAQAQLVKDPTSGVWLKRLAQVAEWNREPALALKTWLDYAQRTDDPAGWSNVQRIAPMLHDDDAWLVALRREAKAKPDNLDVIDAVTGAYERLGRPDDALAFLKSLPHGKARDALDERTGQLAERAGRYDDALAIYRALLERHPHDPRSALHVANVLYRNGDYAGALAALDSARAGASDRDVEFWRNDAELARLLQRVDSANLAHRHLLASGEATTEDLAEMASFYDAYPLDAGRLAELRYRSAPSVTALRDAIYFYTGANAMDRIAALLKSLTPDELREAEASSAFLAARAEYYRQTGRPADALHDLQRAVELPDAPADTRAALLWTLVDYGDDAQLRRAFFAWHDEAQTNPALWGAYAAAAQRLGRASEALAYLRRQATLSRDPLWLLSYADAQEAAGRADLAWSIRRKVWDQIRAEDPQFSPAKAASGTRPRTPTAAPSVDEEAAIELRSRRVALSREYANADLSAAMLDALLANRCSAVDLSPARRSLLGDAPGLPSAPPASTANDDGRHALCDALAHDVAIAWALSHEANPLAKRWLAQQYANRLARPADAQLTLALASGDTATMRRVLADQGSRVPRNDRIDAALALERPREAAALAFAGVDGAPENTALHQRLVETTLAWPQSIDAGVANYVEHPLDYVEQTLAGSYRFAEHYMVGITGVQDFQRSTDASQLVNVPSVDRSVSAYLRRQTSTTAFTVRAGRRDGLDSFDTASVEAQFGRNSPFGFSLAAGRNQVADETPVLHVGAIKDNLIASANYALGARLTLSGRVEADRFYSQARTFLGSGVLTNAELSYRIRTEYPDYALRLVGTRGDYSASGRADALISSLIPSAAQPATAASLMPDTYFQYGLFFSFGTDLLEQYTHRWRPFLDVGILHDSIQGWGPGINAGLAGTVFGGDHAALFVEHQRVSRVGTPVTVIGARYSWYY
jgi:hypothetical protein